MDRIANFLAGNIDFDLAGDLVVFADQFEFVTDHVENAALLEARAGFFVEKYDRNRDFDLAALGKTEEVDVFGTIVDGVERHVLGKRLDLLATELDLDDRVHEVAGAELADQFLRFHVDHRGFFLAAINHGGDAAFATQCTGGSLASPFARLGRQGQSIAHVAYLSKYVWLHVRSTTPPGMTMVPKGARLAGRA